MICTIQDDFIENKTQWVATLCDGTVVYKDDEREGQEIPSAWIRLQKYCKENKKSIIDLHLRFRSNIIHALDKNSEGYFFANKIFQLIGGPAFNFFVVGTVKENKILTKTFKIPELIQVEESERNLEDYEDFVILRSK